MLTDKAHRDGTYFSCPFFAPCCYNFCMSMQGYATHTQKKKTHLCSVAFVCSFSCGERPE
jgi:hypothetical protein